MDVTVRNVVLVIKPDTDKQGSFVQFLDAGPPVIMSMTGSTCKELCVVKQASD